LSVDHQVDQQRDVTRHGIGAADPLAHGAVGAADAAREAGLVEPQLDDALGQLRCRSLA
jgi:hypothetical protein